MNIARIVWARLDTITTTNAFVVIDEDDAIFPLIRCTGWTNALARRIFAVHTIARLEFQTQIRKCASRSDAPNPVAMLAKRNLILNFACDHTRFAIDTALGFDDKTPTSFIFSHNCLYAL
jgi:hypothetical protein